MWHGTGGDLERLAAALTRRGPDFGRSFQIVMVSKPKSIRRIDQIVTQRIVALRRMPDEAAL
jgi:hypothetical protein